MSVQPQRAILIGPRAGRDSRANTILASLDRDPLRDVVIAVDGGVDHLENLGVPFSEALAIGDWDSLSDKKILKKIQHETLPVQKNRSDFAHALLLAREMGVSEIVAIGFTGGRADHHLAAILDLTEFTAHVKPKEPVFAHAIDATAEYHWVPQKSAVEFEILKGRVFSVFSVGGTARGVNIQGAAKYPLKNAELTSSSHGLSNVSTSSRQAIVVEAAHGQLLVVIPQDSP